MRTDWNRYNSRNLHHNCHHIQFLRRQRHHGSVKLPNKFLKMETKFLTITKVAVYSLMIFSAISAWAMPANLPPGQAVTPDEISNLVTYVGQFLVVMSVTIAVIIFVISGITYMTAAGNPERVKKAQAIFKNGVIGTLIVLGVGVIINTLAGVVTRDFFCQLRVPIIGICLY